MEKSELIFKVLSNEASKEEGMELDNWISRSETNRNDYEDLKLLHEGRGVVESDLDGAYYAGLKKIKATIKKKIVRRRQMLILSMILIAFFILLFIYFMIPLKFLKENDSGVVKFNHAPMSQIISVLEKKYDIRIVIPAKLLNCEFTGSFYNDSAKDALRHLAESMDFQCNVVNDQVFKLNGRGCTQ